jgi:cobalt/nickel transport system permease protein
MHIYEGILSGTPHGQELLLAGAVASAIGTAIGLYKLDYEQLPRVGVLSSTFFVASLIHIPLGATSEHLVLAGLLGLVLGWAAFPAVLVALLLQAVFFSVGGLTTLGLNTLTMALPAVVCYYCFRGAVRGRHEGLVYVAGFAAGALAILLGATLNVSALTVAGKSFEFLAKLVAILHIPLAVIEGFVTGSIVVLLRKVRPELLDAPPLVPVAQEVFDA